MSRASSRINSKNRSPTCPGVVGGATVLFGRSLVGYATVITDSCNFSETAEANDENLLLIESAQVAAACSSYFNTLYRAYGGR
jgi:hypothetical protein